MSNWLWFWLVFGAFMSKDTVSWLMFILILWMWFK